ncbi:serine/threonine protein kinase [Kribbella albertanoniae]|uniref:Serine/threonine protein kinase n=1 Tax=Kribbella albertanoniae TaxID=1266829 RepID=A0A4R4QJQ7_9ACTN|nr:serine/threonine protein kinase [Kribbella albertanoniae]
MQPLQPSDPKRVGRYWLLARLGAGGMGRVYLARSHGGRTVAVKVVRPDLAGDPQFRRRFKVEVAAARLVGGFHTAQVVDADTEADPPWFVTEYIAGPSLQQAVDDHGPLPARSVAALGAGLAEGLTAIHNHVIHRDLKPSNVLLATDGPRIIDFGVARAMDATAQTTRAGLIGTPGFMSPEQYRGREVEPASDVFCLAAVLVFAATGRPPFGTGPGEALGYRVVNEEPDLTSVPASLLPLIKAGLEKDPNDRPSVAEFLDRCATLAEGEALALPPPVATLITTRVAETAALIAAPDAAKPKPVENPDTPRVTSRAPSSNRAATVQLLIALLAFLALVGWAIFNNNRKETRSSDTSAGGRVTATAMSTSSRPTAIPTPTRPTPTTDPTRKAFEKIAAGDCLDAYMDPYKLAEWSRDMPTAVDCDRTDAYMRVTVVGDSATRCRTKARDAGTWWHYPGGGEVIYLCIERQLRVGECILGYKGSKDSVETSAHGLMTSWGCDKTTVPKGFDYILQVTALTKNACPSGSRSWEFRGGKLCARIV